MKLATQSGAICLAMMAISVFPDAPAQAQVNTDLCKQPNATILIVTLESGFRIVYSLQRDGDTIRGVAQAYRTNGISAGHGVVTGQLGGTVQRGRGLVLETRWDGRNDPSSFSGYLFDGAGRGMASDLDNSNPVEARVTTTRGCEKWVPDPKKPAPPPLNSVRRPSVIPPPVTPPVITNYTPPVTSPNRNWGGIYGGIQFGAGSGRVSDNQSRLIIPGIVGTSGGTPGGNNPGGNNPGGGTPGGGNPGSGGSSGSGGTPVSGGGRPTATDDGGNPFSDYTVDYGFGLPPGPPPRIRDRFHMKGVGVSLQTGYNFQLPNNIVIGVEGDIAYTGLSGGGSYFYRGAGFLGIGDWIGNLRLKSDWQASARLRVGYAFGDFLVFAAGGVAFANGTLRDNGAFIDANGRAFLYNSSTRNFHIGWTVGLGAEYAFSNNWRARVEVRYADFQKKQYQTVNGPVRAGWNQTTAVVSLVYAF